jgi:hypothetical protein
MLWPWEIDSLNVSGPELTESLSLSRVDTMLHNTTMTSYESIEHQSNRHKQSVTMLPHHGWLEETRNRGISGIARYFCVVHPK